MPQNQARAPFLVESFPTVPSTSLGDAWSWRSHHDKQNKTKQNKQPSFMVGFTKKYFKTLCLSQLTLSRKIIIIHFQNQIFDVKTRLQKEFFKNTTTKIINLIRFYLTSKLCCTKIWCLR